MSRRRKWIIGAGCGLIVIAALLTLPGGREPAYQGRPLSAWVVSYHQDSNEDAGNAIRQLGTNAIPHLVNWLRDEPSDVKQTWLSRVNRPIEWLHDKLNATGDWSLEDRDINLAAAAAEAFSLLAVHADLAVPPLTRLLNDPARAGRVDVVAESLARLGSPGRAPLMAALEGKNAGLRAIIAKNMIFLGTNATPAAPLLVRLVARGDAQESAAAACTLGTLRIEPELAVPVLLAGLSNTNARTRRFSAMALASYGALARPAIPALTRWLSDDDSDHRRIAADLLPKIDPNEFATPPPSNGEAPSPR